MELFRNLGIELSKEMTTAQTETDIVIQEVLNATGLNWEVLKLPSYYIDPNTGEQREKQDFTNVRSDNGNELKTVGANYTILQNADTARMILESGKELFDISGKFSHPWNNTGEDGSLGNFGNMGGGSLKGGNMVFLQLELPEAYIGRSGIHRYITALNTHDGSKSVAFGNGSQVVCCQNTFMKAFGALSKIRHTASMTERIEEAKQLLQRVLSFEEDQMQTFEAAAKKPLQKSQVGDMIKAIFDEKNFDSTGLIAKEDASTRVKNQVIQFENDLKTSIDEQGYTLWALFNGVTRYTNHSQSVKDNAYSLIAGSGEKLNSKAYEVIKSLV